MFVFEKHRKLCMLKCGILLQTFLLHCWADAGIQKNLYESCEVVTINNCTTEEDYILHDCVSHEPVEADNCNRTAELHCVNQVCHPNCVPTDVLEYDYKRMKCVARVGELCGRLRDCQESAVCKDYSYTGNRICKCPGGTQLVNGKCARLVVYRRECGSESVPLPQRNCDAEARIHCLNGTCQCGTATNQPALNLVFVPKSNRCQARPGQRCTRQSYGSGIDCVPNAYCRFTALCGCEESATLSENGEYCISHKAGAECSPDDPFLQCDASIGLECRNGLCSCKDGRIYNSINYEKDNRLSLQKLGTSKACYIKVGSYCKNEETPVSRVSSNNTAVAEACVPNAVCLDGKCQCKDDYAVAHFTSDYGGWCSLTFGQPCNHSGSALFECNLEHGLACVEGKCGCGDIHFKFNPRTSMCEDTLETKKFTELLAEKSLGVKDKPNSPESGSGYAAPLAAVIVIVGLLIAAILFFKNDIRNLVRNFG